MCVLIVKNSLVQVKVYAICSFVSIMVSGLAPIMAGLVDSETVLEVMVFGACLNVLVQVIGFK